MCHQPAQTLLVAAETAVDLFRLPVFQLVHPIRVCQKLAAHGGALDASAGELLLHKIRVVQTTDTTDGRSVYCRTSSQNLRKHPGWLK